MVHLHILEVQMMMYLNSDIQKDHQSRLEPRVFLYFNMKSNPWNQPVILHFIILPMANNNIHQGDNKNIKIKCIQTYWNIMCL